jgi:hypothetical protein
LQIDEDGHEANQYESAAIHSSGTARLIPSEGWKEEEDSDQCRMQEIL